MVYMGQLPILLPVDFINCSWFLPGFLEHQQVDNPEDSTKKRTECCYLFYPLGWIPGDLHPSLRFAMKLGHDVAGTDLVVVGNGGFVRIFWGIAKGGHYRKTHNTSKVFLHQWFLLKHISTYVSSVCMISMHIFGQLPNPVSSQLHTIVTQEKKHKNHWEPRSFDLRSWCVFWELPRNSWHFLVMETEWTASRWIMTMYFFLLVNGDMKLLAL